MKEVLLLRFYFALQYEESREAVALAAEPVQLRHLRMVRGKST
jgi:hypothetical protein